MACGSLVEVVVANPTWKRHSLEADWEAVAFTGHPMQRTVGEFLAMGALPPGAMILASAGLSSIEAWMSGLATSRKLLDLWRTMVRDQQDAFLAGLRDQLGRATTRADDDENASDETDQANPQRRGVHASEQTGKRVAQSARNESPAGKVAATAN